jgi:hypothetical protein
MRRDAWLTAEEAERERRYIAWCRRWALPVAGGLGLAALALLLWAIWTLSEILFT